MADWSTLVPGIKAGNFKDIARALSLVENGTAGSFELLKTLNPKPSTPIIGVTGPPGAGKSTLLNGLVGHLIEENKKIGIIAVDPSSPFNYGALLGDRIRLQDFFQHPNVFIRSVASRGSLGGVSEKIPELLDVFKAADFDYVFLETVGVGQSEVEVVGLADTTVVILVPEAGDEVQTMKAGLMEIADIFVVNKSDRPESEGFAGNLKKMVHEKADNEWAIPVIKTVATQTKGIPALVSAINAHHKNEKIHRSLLLTKRAYHFIQRKRMEDVDKKNLNESVKTALEDPNFNFYKFLEKYLQSL